MNPKIARGSEVTRPATTPLTSSVLDHATVTEKSSFGLQNNEGLWPSYNCLDTLVPTPICPDPVAANYLEFSFGGWQPAFEFAVHGGVQCSAVGLDVEDMRSEISRVFAANEGKGVERSLLENRFIADTGAGDLWDDPVEVAPSPVALGTALALLEGYAAVNYAGVPTIHMPRAVASLLFDRLVWRDGKAYTTLGSKVAIGGGYDAQGGTAGEWDIYATGEVYVERSDTLELSAFTIPGDGSGASTNGLDPNTQVAVATRMYRVAVDCFAAKVTGTIASSSGGGGSAGIVDNGDGTWSAA